MIERQVPRWKWHQDWAGFSGPLWPTETKRSQLTIQGIYDFGYFATVCLPIVGDLTVGFHTNGGLRNPRNRNARRLVFDRAPWPERETA